MKATDVKMLVTLGERAKVLALCTQLLNNLYIGGPEEHHPSAGCLFRGGTVSRFWFWLTHNASSAHCRVLANFLRRRGWVVFYLDERSRDCRHVCWLKLYEEGERRG